IDISKLLNEDRTIDLLSLELVTRLGINFLDSIISRSIYPTDDIYKWAINNRAIGLGIMGLADYFLKRKIIYGSPESLEELEFIMNFIYKIAEDESIILGEELGVPSACKNLPNPRRNITLLSIAPTGSISLLAGCSSGIEPIFSEITNRKDTTGTYQLIHPDSNEDYFRCAVSSNGIKEVSWNEHLLIQNSAQRFVDSGVSKTINCPNGTRKKTIYDLFLTAWKLPYIKGLTVYRNGSRKEEVLTPKNLKKDMCPVCGSELVKGVGCKKCDNCGFGLCDA
ncbi:hypothetical protein LCGC14_2246340, partial [marine sediment metagenome]